MSDLTLAILEELARPFPSAAIKWKPQRTTQDKQRAEAVAFIDARDVSKRLDETVGGDWSVEYEPILGGPQNSVSLICKLTVCGTMRSGIGSFEQGGGSSADPWKSAESDALKRAAVHFGIARYLYDLGTSWMPYDAERRRLKEVPKLPDWALPEEERGKAQANGHSGDEPEQAPAAPKANGNVANPGSMVMNGGKYKGQTIAQIAQHDLGYLQWKIRNAEEKGKWYPDDTATKQYLESLAAAGAPEPLDGNSAPFDRADKGVGKPEQVAGVQKGATALLDAKPIGELKGESKQRILTTLKSLQMQAEWDDPHLVGHIAKHFQLPVKAGVTTVDDALPKVTVEQARVLKHVLETVIQLQQAFRQSRKQPHVVISWINENLGKSYTDRKDTAKIADELDQDERETVLEYLSTDDGETEAADLTAEFNQ